MEHRAAILSITAVFLSIWIAAPTVTAAGATPSAAVTATTIVASGATGAWANEPERITDLSPKTALSPSEKARIKAYAQFWTTRLKQSAQNPQDCKEARRRLTEPLDRGGVTEVFRTRYGSALKPGLDDVLLSGNAHTCVVATIVLSHVGTEDAMRTLLDHCALSVEKRRHVRLAAARGCRQMLDSGLLDEMKPNKIVGATRRLAAAAGEETDPFTIRHQLEAILAADRITLAAGTRGQIRSSLISALEKTAKRAEAAPADGHPSALELLDATYFVLYRLRNEFIDPGRNTSKEQIAFGKKLGPCLYQMLYVPKAHWQNLQNMPRTKNRFGQIIGLCERMLKTVDLFVRPDRTSLETQLLAAWNAGDADRYGRDLQRWKDILKQPPY